jgi:hypothetical protein
MYIYQHLTSDGFVNPLKYRHVSSLPSVNEILDFHSPVISDVMLQFGR